MKRYLPFVIIIAVGALTLGAGMMLYRGKMRAFATQGAQATSAEKSGLKPRHVRGEADAPITLEEFGDFQCPACGTTAGVLKMIEAEYGQRLRVIFRQFPLAMHPHGRDAALVAEAASIQGQFWPMHDLLYENQMTWSKEPDTKEIFDRYAASLGLDMSRFHKDLAGEEVAARVNADQKLGESRGVKNTPTIFINDHIMPPPFTPERLHEAIDAALLGKTFP